MNHPRSITLITLVFAVIILAPALTAETVTTSWGGDAEQVYDSGFMHMLKKHSGGGVSLFDMELVQNDAPGAGASEKGVWTDTVWGKNRARKVLGLDDPRAQKAYLVVFSVHPGKYPLKFTVNGLSSEVSLWDTTKNQEIYRWAEFPVSSLKKGKNVIDLFCPEALERSGRMGALSLPRR